MAEMCNWLYMLQADLKVSSPFQQLSRPVLKKAPFPVRKRGLL